MCNWNGNRHFRVAYTPQNLFQDDFWYLKLYDALLFTLYSRTQDI